MSATLGNLDIAQSALLGTDRAGVLIDGDLKKKFEVEVLIPKDMEKFPLGRTSRGEDGEGSASEQIEKAGTTLVFTNVRSQTEFWFNALLEARPDWEEQIGIHHGSIDRKERKAVEERLRDGSIRAVVCTSSLDLGVDFSPVDQVIQIGGPKGVARLLQRAGRCGHQPGAVSRVLCVPTHAMELVEYAAAREAINERRIEAREPIRAPLDLLAQHMITLALGGGFFAEEVLKEIRTAWSYRNLSDEEWGWVPDFIIRGGDTLRAYDQFKRVVVDTDGLHRVESRLISVSPDVDRHHHQRSCDRGKICHRPETWHGGGVLHFRIKPGGNFYFSGKLLTLKRVRDLTAVVTRGKKGKGAIPVWGGGKSPLSSELAVGVRQNWRLQEKVCSRKPKWELSGHPLIYNNQAPTFPR